MNKCIATVSLGLLGLSPNQAAIAKDKLIDVKTQPETELVYQVAKAEVSNTYVPKADEFKKPAKQAQMSAKRMNQLEDEAIIKIVQNSPDECHRLLDKYIKMKKTPPKNYWQVALDSLKTIGRIK